jgi:hypothetical protein
MSGTVARERTSPYGSEAWQPGKRGQPSAPWCGAHDVALFPLLDDGETEPPVKAQGGRVRLEHVQPERAPTPASVCEQVTDDRRAQALVLGGGRDQDAGKEILLLIALVD